MVTIYGEEYGQYTFSLTVIMFCTLLKPVFFSIVHTLPRSAFSQLSKPGCRTIGVDFNSFIADFIRQMRRAVGFFLAARPSISSPLASWRISKNLDRGIRAFAITKKRSLPSTQTAAFSNRSSSWSSSGTGLTSRFSNSAGERPLAQHAAKSLGYAGQKSLKSLSNGIWLRPLAVLRGKGAATGNSMPEPR